MDYLPQVRMDFIPSDDEDENRIKMREKYEKEANEISDEIEIDINDFDQEKDIDVQSENNITKGISIKVSETDITEGISISDDKPIPKVKSKRENMNPNDIFNLPEEKKQEVEATSVKLTKKGLPRKKRPPMSEEHKKKLALAREKATIARKNKAKERQEAKELEKQEKQLLKKQKEKRVKQLKEEVDETDETITKKTNNSLMFSKKDLEDAQLNAIMNYEKIRKERKKEKQEKQKKEKEQEQIKATLRRAVQPQQEYNPFNGCY